MKVYHKKSFY